jgi:hypothetical protein
MVNLYNINSIDGTTTFEIQPAPGYGINASQFPTIGATSYYSSITFSDSTSPDSLDNTVIGTINWITQNITEDTTLPAIDLSFVVPSPLPKRYYSILNIYHDKNINPDTNNYFPGISTESGDISWSESTGVLTYNSTNAFSYSGVSGLWPPHSEDNQVFKLTYTISNSNMSNGEFFKLAPFGDHFYSSSDTVIPIENGTHEVNLTVNNPGTRANAFYVYGKAASGKTLEMSNISITRVDDQTEAISFSDVNSSLTISDDLLPTSPTRSRFLITGTLPGDQNNELYKVKLSSYDGKFYGADAQPQMVFNEEAINAGHTLGLENSIENQLSQVVAKEVSVNWFSESNIVAEDNVNIAFGQGSVLKSPEARFVVDNFFSTSSAQVVSIQMQSTTLNNTIASPDAWITVPSNQEANFGGLLQGGNFGSAYIDATLAVNSTGSARTGTITITNEYNDSGTPDDTISITQASTSNFVDIYTPSANVSFTGGSSDYPIVNVENGDNYIPIEIQFAATVSGISTSNMSITINSGDAGWLSLPSSISAPTTIQMGNIYSGMYLYTMTIKATTTDALLTSRSATLKVWHGVDTSTFDEVTFTQGIFDPTTDTLTTSIPGGSSFGTSSQTATLRLTSSVVGTPTPVVVLAPAKSWDNPQISNNNVNNIVGEYNNVEDFVTIGEVQVVTGEPYTHKVDLVINSFTDADANDIRTQRIMVYHPNDIGYTTPRGQNIAQSYIYNDEFTE